MVVRDDGRGIDEHVLASGRDGSLGPLGHARARPATSARGSRCGAVPRPGPKSSCPCPTTWRFRHRQDCREATHERQTKIRVFSVDDHPLLREGIAALINSQPDMVLVAHATSGREAMQRLSRASARRHA